MTASSATSRRYWKSQARRWRRSKARSEWSSGLHPRDVETVRAAQAALRMEWCASRPEDQVEKGGDAAKFRLAWLFKFLRSGRLEVRVLPDEKFGLIHGKAGVITLVDGQKISFLGRVNEAFSACGSTTNCSTSGISPSCGRPNR